ncbi:MAG: M23 family metallopeptidase [Alistipes sp.]
MQRLLLILITLFSVQLLSAQALDTTQYVYPLKNVARLYSSNFGEMRSNHFHSGIDIKTDAVSGKRVVAVADGYISRIFLSPYGFGRALYITHPNGKSSVYGHLSSFRQDIEAFVRAERYRTGSDRVNLFCSPTQYPVRQGDEIALSGNAGQSFGPHLHFELRDTRTQRTLNTMAAGIITPNDNIPPQIVRLYYVEVDTVCGVPIHSTPRPYVVTKVNQNTYKLHTTTPVPVGRQGYFLLEATDRKNGVANTFGIYHITESIDGEVVYDYRMDGFLFSQTRYCNAVAYYPIQRTSRNEIFRLTQLAGNSPALYTVMKNRALLITTPDQQNTIRLEVQDDRGNYAQLTFTTKGSANTFQAQADTTAPIVNRSRDFVHTEDNLTVHIPKGSLYESIFYSQSHRDLPPPKDTTFRVLSPAYTVLNHNIPLHTAITISIQVDVPAELQAHTTLAMRSQRGRISYLGGKYDGQAVSVKTRTFGEYLVVADTLAPTITPLFKVESDFTEKESARFRLSDNFSGLASYVATIDGRQALIDYNCMQGVASILLDDSICPRGRQHTIVFKITDNCGNTSQWKGGFYR